MSAPLVLVVEDNATLQRLAELHLKHLGLEVHTALNGREAVQAASRQHYSLILMDISMPEMDGIEATKAIRKMERRLGGHVPIVAVTGIDTREHCLAAGMDDYAVKPANYKQIVDRWLPARDGQPSWRAESRI